MPKTLKLDTLKGFKPKGVNLDKTIIDSALKEFSEFDETIGIKEVLAGSSVSTLNEDTFSVKEKYRKEIQILKAENEKLKFQVSGSGEFPQVKSRKLRNNLSKFMKAIKSEAILQGTKWPTNTKILRFGCNFVSK